MQTPPSHSISLPRRLGEAVLLILAIQAARAVVTVAAWTLFRPAPTDPAWTWIDIIAYLLVGASLIQLFWPSPARLGIDWTGLSRRTRILVIAGAVLLLVLVLTTFFFDPRVLLDNVKNALLIPVFEELIFRGWIWGRLEEALPQRRRGLWAWLITSVLFAFWHLGYMDIYLLRALPANPGLQLGPFLLMKVLTTFAIGLVVGLPRWPTRRTFASIFLHALINLFGR